MDAATGLDPGHHGRILDGTDGTRVAIFDLDRTLVPGSSLMVFGRELVHRGFLPRRTLARHALADLRFRRRGLGDARVAVIRDGVLALVAGMEHAPLAAMAESVGRALADARVPRRAVAGRPPRRRRRLLRDRVGVTTRARGRGERRPRGASGRGHPAPAARRPLHRGDRRRLLLRRGQARPARREVGAIDFSHAIAYADSVSDLPLLRRCGAAVAVNPDRGLRAEARAHGWPQLAFSR